MLAILKEAVINSVGTVIQIASVVIPLMIVLRFARETDILDKISGHLEPVIKKIYLPKEATFPLLIGLFFGISYGAGVIIKITREINFKERDLFLLNTFLGLCHAAFEDTFVFAAIGANPFIIFGSRLFFAVLATYFLGKWLYKKEKLAYNKNTIKG